MFHTFYRNNDPLTAKGLCQLQDTRYLVQNPPALPSPSRNWTGCTRSILSAPNIPFTGTRDSQGAGDDQILPHHAPGLLWRVQLLLYRRAPGQNGAVAEPSLCREGGRRLAELPDFKGYIQDVGGPTANMYGFE